MKKSRMFRSVEATWTPYPGCTHQCAYWCWARDGVAPRIGSSRNCELCKKHIPHPHFEMPVPNAKLIFVNSWGDLFCDGVKDEYIVKTVELGPKRYPNIDFLFCTKNTPRYFDFVDIFPPNCILGGTIETNRDGIYPKSRAPLPSVRFKSLRDLDYSRKFFSAEPLIDFDLDIFPDWIIQVNPEHCEIGYDNYPKRTFKRMGKFLTEPSKFKAEQLIQKIREAGIDTKEKTIRKAVWEDPNFLKTLES